jgi:hypothetical protein
MSILIQIGYGMGGVLIFKFVSLILWDLFGWVPLPWGTQYRSPDADASAKFKTWFMIWMFVGGCAVTLAGFLWGDELPLITVSNRLALLGGFSVPVICCFVLRCTIAIAYCLVLLYQETEHVYDDIKERGVRFSTWCSKELRRRGLKE